MRPKFKSDTFYIPIEGGVYLRNNERSSVIKGQTVATWIERLAPYLDGRYDLERLCRSVPAAKQPMISKLIETLAEQGYIKDAAGDRAHTLTSEILTTYAPAITFIDYHTDSAAYRFEQFLALPVLAIGSGDALVALAHALLETGNRHIYLLDTQEETTDYTRIMDYLTMLRANRDAALALHTLTLADWSDDQALQGALSAFSMVIFYSTNGSTTLARRLTRLCYQAGILFLPAVVLGDQMVIGPTHHPHTPGCWECYWRRRQAASGLPATDEQGMLLPPSPGQSTQLAAPAIAITANLLAFEFFKQGTGISTHTLDEQVFVLDLETLQSATHRLFAHPCCSICTLPFPTARQDICDQAAAACDELHTLQQSNTTMDTHQLLQHTNRWVDAHTGIFTRIDERDFFQLPLIRSQITIASPSPAGLLMAHAAGLDYAEARALAVHTAALRYLENLVDPRRALSATYAQLRAHQDLPHPRQFFGWASNDFAAEQIAAWFWAWWVTSDRPVLVPAAAIYPNSLWNWQNGSSLFQPGTSGTGIGATWHEALAHALLALGQALDTTTAIPARPIALSAYAGDSVCATYLKMLNILDVRATLVDTTGPLGLPRIATYLVDRYIGSVVHWDAMVAAREALKAAVLAIQLERFSGHDGRPAYCASVPTHPDGPEFTGGDADIQPAAALPITLAEAMDYPAAVQTLHDRFRSHGWDLIAAHIGTDTTVATVFGCALRVLAVQRQA
jgi:putative thiazole-containing bacteriocin maturation protein